MCTVGGVGGGKEELAVLFRDDSELKVPREDDPDEPAADVRPQLPWSELSKMAGTCVRAGAGDEARLSNRSS